MKFTRCLFTSQSAWNWIVLQNYWIGQYYNKSFYYEQVETIIGITTYWKNISNERTTYEAYFTNMEIYNKGLLINSFYFFPLLNIRLVLWPIQYYVIVAQRVILFIFTYLFIDFNTRWKHLNIIDWWDKYVDIC